MRKSMFFAIFLDDIFRTEILSKFEPFYIFEVFQTHTMRNAFRSKIILLGIQTL